jgi:thioredoxin-dependent peroxiredoxin
MDYKLSVGDKAPDFMLDSEEGKKSLSDYRGQWVVLYFYPRDFTSGCTTQACDLRDISPTMDAVILGVSPDSVDSHQRFKAEHNLNFLLLADEDNRLAKAYGAYGKKQRFGKESEGIIRSTFIIDPEGNVAETMYNVNAAQHATKVSERVKQLRAA